MDNIKASLEDQGFRGKCMESPREYSPRSLNMDKIQSYGNTNIKKTGSRWQVFLASCRRILTATDEA